MDDGRWAQTAVQAMLARVFKLVRLEYLRRLQDLAP
jgi:hypothetical protein